jgi:hypothetical protein
MGVAGTSGIADAPMTGSFHHFTFGFRDGFAALAKAFFGP